MGDHKNVGVTLVDASRVSATGFDGLVLENRPLAMRNNSDSIVHVPSHVMRVENPEMNSTSTRCSEQF